MDAVPNIFGLANSAIRLVYANVGRVTTQPWSPTCKTTSSARENDFTL